MNLKDTKEKIRSVLFIFENGCLLSEFASCYQSLIGEKLPSEKFNYESDFEFLQSMPDVVSMTWLKSGDFLLKVIITNEFQQILNPICWRKPLNSGPSEQLSYELPLHPRTYILKKSVVKDLMNKVIELLLNYPEGLLLSNFMDRFVKLFGVKFPFKSIGFRSLEQCLVCFPELILKPKNKDTMIYHKSFSKDENEDKSTRLKSFTINKESPLELKNRKSSWWAMSKNYRYSLEDCEYTVSKKKSDSLTISKANQNLVNLKKSQLPEQSASFDKKTARLCDKPSIPDEVRWKLQKVIEKYPRGIYAVDFPLLYEEVNYVKFDLHDLGYISLADFVDHVPDILKRKHIAGNKKDWLIFPGNVKKKTTVKDILSKDSDQRTFYIENTIWNIRKLLHDYPDGITLHDFLHVYSINNKEPLYIRELGFSDIESFLLSISERVPLQVDTEGSDKILHFVPNGSISRRQNLKALTTVGDESIPHDAASPDSEFRMQELEPNFDYAKYKPVYVAEVFHPDHFYIHLIGQDTSDALDILHEKLNEFYCGPLGNDYKMKNADIKIGAVCAALWPSDNFWYRTKILSIPSMEEVELLYVDYGNKQVVSIALLRYIRQEFMNLPVQAIKSQLAFIKPREKTWPMPDIQKKLLSLCKDKQLMAKIVERRADRILSLILCDTSGGKEVYINNVLVVEGYARSELVDMYSVEAAQASDGNNIPSFQTGSTLNVSSLTPDVVGASTIPGNDVLNLLQSLAISYAHNPRLIQQHYQHEITNPFFNVPSIVNTGSPGIQMSPLSNGTGLASHFPIFPLSGLSTNGANLPVYANLPVADHNNQYMKSEVAPFCVKVKERKKSSDDSERPKLDEKINGSTGKLKSLEELEELQQCHEKALLHIKGIKEVYKYF